MLTFSFLGRCPDQLEATNFVQGQDGFYAMERIDILWMDEDGKHHTLPVTYHDVMGV